jgi:hypothetical protein
MVMIKIGYYAVMALASFLLTFWVKCKINCLKSEILEFNSDYNERLDTLHYKIEKVDRKIAEKQEMTRKKTKSNVE